MAQWIYNHAPELLASMPLLGVIGGVVGIIWCFVDDREPVMTLREYKRRTGRY